MPLFQIKKIHFYITSSHDEPSCFIIKDKEVYAAAKKGEISEAVVLFANPGIYETYCPAGKLKGEIVVLEHPRVKKERQRRSLASKSNKIIKVWRPKDD